MPTKKNEPKSKPEARKPTVGRRRRATPTVTHEQIAQRAYYLSLERGEDPLVNWLEAERELLAA